MKYDAWIKWSVTDRIANDDAKNCFWIKAFRSRNYLPPFPGWRERVTDNFNFIHGPLFPFLVSWHPASCDSPGQGGPLQLKQLVTADSWVWPGCALPCPGSLVPCLSLSVHIWREQSRHGLYSAITCGLLNCSSLQLHLKLIIDLSVSHKQFSLYAKKLVFILLGFLLF